MNATDNSPNKQKKVFTSLAGYIKAKVSKIE